MPSFTGVLGTKDSQLGNFVLGKGPAVGAENSQSVESNVAVAQAIAFRNAVTRLTVTSTTTVTPAAVGRDDISRQAIESTITVTPTVVLLLAPFLRCTQEVVEVFYQSNPPARITQLVIEVFYRKAQELTVTSTVAVAQTIDTPQRNVTMSVTSAVGVASTGSGRDDHDRQTVSQGVTVTPIIVPSGVNRQTVTSAVAVAPTANGRNNNVRISLTQAIGVANTDSGHNDSLREDVDSTANVLSVAAGRNNNRRLTIFTIVTTADLVTDHNTNPRRTVTQGIVVSTAISAVVPHAFVTSAVTVTPTINARSTVVRRTIESAIAVAQDAVGRNTNPRESVTSAVTILSSEPRPVQFRLDHNDQTTFSFVAVDPTIVANSTRQLVTTTINVDSQARGSAYSQTVTTQVFIDTFVVGGDNNRRQTVTSDITVTPVAGGSNAVQRLSLSHAVHVDPTIIGRGPVVTEVVAHSIHVASTATDRNLAVQNVRQEVFVEDSIRQAGDKPEAVTSVVTVAQTIRDSPIVQSVTTTATVGQRIQELEPTVTSKVTVTPRVNKTADVHLADSLTFVQETAAPKTMTHTLVDTLDLQQVLDRSVVWHRSLADVLVFPDQYYIRATSISSDPIVVPVATGTIVSAIVLLTSKPGGAITLPTPQFDDSRANAVGITLKRTMDGGTYSFVRSSDRQKLVWTFKIAQAKAIELRDWITKSLSQELRITDWLGRVWVAKMTINPPSLSADGRFASEVEYIMVELQFDGVKISG